MRRFALSSRTALAARPRVASARSQSAAALRIVHVTDVYTLDNFPHLKTLIVEKREEFEQQHGPDAVTISVLTGDFLMPYLLSAIDKGRGMMKMLNRTPVDYLIWGNHEDNLSPADVFAREREYKGSTRRLLHHRVATQWAEGPGRPHAIDARRHLAQHEHADARNCRRFRVPGDACVAHGRRQTNRHARRHVAHVAQARRVQRRSDPRPLGDVGGVGASFRS